MQIDVEKRALLISEELVEGSVEDGVGELVAG
jgi:hypothetical protein